MSGHDGGPAFPVTWQDGDGRWVDSSGMTLRDWFAGQALAGDIAGSTRSRPTPDNAAAYAYEVADAMLRARGGGA